MAGITLADAQATLALYQTAERKILLGQKVDIDGQSLTRANLKDVREGMTYWDGKCKELAEKSAGRGRSRAVVPRW